MAVFITRLNEMSDKAKVMLAMEEIFFEAALVKDFTSDQARIEFRERWLGRYLRRYPEWVYIAEDCHYGVIGYLVGCIGEVSTYTAFQFHSMNYPAHLHINIDRDFRGQGIGERLIEAFAADAAKAGAEGVHVVTGLGMRNMRFYEKCGFREIAAIHQKGGGVVFLAKKLR